MEHKLLLSIFEAQSATGMGKTTLYGLIKEGKLKPIKIGRRTFILPDDLKRLIAEAAV